MLSREQIRRLLAQWNLAWERHDLDGVMGLFHEDVTFENWTGARVRGKENLRKAWEAWFQNHGGFRFTEEETFVDERAQKALYRWHLQWPCRQRGREGRIERRRGVDVLHFRDGKIIHKLTYSKTTMEIEGERIALEYPSWQR